MKHYLIDGVTVPYVAKPNVGEIMYGEQCAGKGTEKMMGVEYLVMQFLIAVRRFPELRDKYTWAAITNPDDGFDFELINPIGEDDDKGPDMVPDPLGGSDQTERSDSSESTPKQTPNAGTGNTSLTSDSTSDGVPRTFKL